MKLPSFLDFSANIRTHGAFVGVLLIAITIPTLVLAAVSNFRTEDLPVEVKHIGYMHEAVLIAGTVKILFTVIFWIGFLKRKRWCLTVFVVFLAVALTLLYLGLLGAILLQHFLAVCFMLIALAASKYVLLVTLQLREVNSNEMVPLERCEFENPILKLQGDTFNCKVQVS
uniref:Uncharacterized protein n=1 Tax=Anopheles dirus TaxID=7168 RepID=A0A182NKK6_9DIPT